MTLTKQDLLRIIALIEKRSKKDSDFKEIEVATTETKVPVLHYGYNRLLPIDTLVKYVCENMDLADIPVSIPGFEAKDLDTLLLELSTKQGQGSGGGRNPMAIDAKHITYITRIDGQKYNNVKTVLDYIVGVLTGTINYPNVASKTDINNIFNS